MNLDTYMDDFGRDLTRAARARSRRRRRLIRLAPAIPVGAALALALALLGGSGGSDDALAKARAALAPNGEIVHMKVQMGISGRYRMPVVEQWYAAEPKRWRTRSEAIRIGPHRRTLHFETAFSNERMRFYDRRRDVVTIWRNEHLRGDLMGPSLLGGDPASDLREQLSKGNVRDDGVVTVDGRKVRRLVQDIGGKQGFGQRFVYYMDPTTFAPISGHLSIERKGKRYRGPAFKVVLYERLPLNEQTEQLLKFEKTPDTRYVWR